MNLLVVLTVLCALCTVAVGEEDNVCQKYGINKSILDLDVEWIMQGYSIGFQGFFVELLGFSSSLVTLLPQLRLVKSSFRKSFAESPFQNEESFLNVELFAAEERNIRILTSDNVVQKVTSVPQPVGFGGITSALCQVPSTFEHSYGYAGGELAKHLSKQSSAVDCCEACVAHPLCLAWTFDVGDGSSALGTCSLKGKMDQSGTTSSTATSGRMFTRPATADATVEASSESSVAPMRRRRPAPRVLIYHGTTCIYRNQSVSMETRDINTVLIGRYMLERPYLVGGYNLDEYAVLHCAARMDEIWVPTEWHKMVFHRLLTQQGSASSIPHITVIPEAVDTTLFDPVFVRTGTARSIVDADRNMLVDASRTSANDTNRVLVHKECAIADDDGVVCSGDQRFEFLSVFKWEYRKGWDVMLDAYWAAFKPTDAVLLRVRSYVPFTSGGDRNITRLMEKHALQTLDKSLAELAPVVWEIGVEGFTVAKVVASANDASDAETAPSAFEGAVDDIAARLSKQETALTREDMRDLLASANAFVLATRGEGWGLPIAEAMSMALPVIVTNHSGPTAFATADNSYLIPVLPEQDSMSFAKPDVGALTTIMRQVVHDASATGGYVAQQKGLAARTTMQQISPDSIVCKMNERLRYHASIRGWNFP